MNKQKEFKGKNTNSDIKEVEMAKKRWIKDQCYEVREKNTSAGKKGTIIRKCPKSKPKPKPEYKELRKYLLGK